MFLKDINATADIVPAFKISKAEEMGSAVDRTQLHNQFINSELSQKQRNDVRLLKSFLNARNVYGAEARIEGFSGYLCELLVYYYGSFIGVMEAFCKLKLPVAIDIINRGNEKHNVAEMAKRFNSEFIVVDPTDHNRNVAANVSKESLAKTVLGARAFLKEPSINTFYTKGYSGLKAKDTINKLGGILGIDVFVITFGLPDMTEDIPLAAAQEAARQDIPGAQTPQPYSNRLPAEHLGHRRHNGFLHTECDQALFRCHRAERVRRRRCRGVYQGTYKIVRDSHGPRQADLLGEEKGGQFQLVRNRVQ